MAIRRIKIQTLSNAEPSVNAVAMVGGGSTNPMPGEEAIGYRNLNKGTYNTPF